MTEKMCGKLLSLADIEGKVSPHQMQLKGSLKQRAVALELVRDVSALAAYLGGQVESMGIGESWAVSKDPYPHVRVYFVFTKGDGEFPAILRALYGGDKIGEIHGDELATITISMANQMLRYVRDANQGGSLPEICYRV